jgi:methionine synthase reductase
MAPHTDKHFLLIYSTQTGQAQAIAEEFAQKAEDAGLKPELHCISQTEKKVRYKFQTTLL